MLILILIDVRYSQTANFSFEKGLNPQKSLLLRFPSPSKKIPPLKTLDVSSRSILCDVFYLCYIFVCY